MQAYCLFIVLVTIIPCFYCFPLFPYGTGNGDNSFTDCDDCCTDPISLNNFPYFGSTYSSFTVGSNGIIILDGCVTTFTPIAFPSSDTPLIAPYWGDVDLEAEGSTLFYSLQSGPSPIDSIAGFTSTEWIRATWETVGFYSADNSRQNTFQAIVATDGSSSYSCFVYPDDVESGNINGGLDWTTGDASSGSEGLGGTPAQVGFDAGDSVNFFSLPDSQTDSIRAIDGVLGSPPANPASGVGTNEKGLFCYRIDQTTISCDPNLSPVGAICPDNYVVDANTNCEGFLTTIASATGCSSSVSHSPGISSPLSLGSNTITATATDSFGNTDSCTFTVTVVDNTDPIITCPSDYNVFADSTCMVSHTGGAAATDNCGTSITYIPQGTSNLSLGSNTITATATDSSGNTDSCTFTVTVEYDDTYIPSNSECIDAYEISNYDRIFGTTSCSSSKTSDIPSCSSSIEGSPVLFYKYTSLYDYEEIIIDTCLSNSDFDTYLSVYIGDCDNLQCIGFDNDSCDERGNDGDDDDYNLNKSKVILSGTDNGVAAGTNIIIAVHGTDYENGYFTLRIQEKEELPNTCNSNGPYIQCPSSIQIPSTIMCEINQQCAITPSFNMGSCSDLCGCSIQQINGPEPGDEISGRNSVTLQATNNNDISNECSFNIIVQNSCNTNGPIVNGCEDLIYLETENDCSTNDGNECVVLNTNGMGAICHDSCGCSIYQSSGPVSGDKLEPGTYEIVYSGVNDLGMESSSSSSCVSTIVVQERS